MTKGASAHNRSTPLLRKDGSVNIIRRGVPRHTLTDLYHAGRSISWPRLLGISTAVWLIINCVFAGLYLLGGNCIAGAEPGSFADAFFFSVQTLATIGYGGLTPVTPYANVLVTIEALLGILISAVLTGLVFGKFSTPTARVAFARTPLITDFDGRRVFMFRMANERTSYVLEATIRLTMIRDYKTAEGEHMRRFVDLKLERTSSPIFALGWTAIHHINEESPLYNLTADQLEALNAFFLVTLTGTDMALATGIYARYAYVWSDVRFDHRYVDTLTSGRNGEPSVVDYAAFHDTEPLRQSIR